MRFFALCLTLIVFLSTPASAQEKLLDIQEITSPGGIKAWLVEDHSVPIIAVSFAFRGAGGALDPEDKQGLALMASNTMDEGAGELDAQAFQKELRDLSISLSYSADRDNFTGGLKTLTKNSARGFELLQMSLLHPRFDTEAIDRMRAANTSRIRSSLSNPDWMAARLINDKAFEGHPYALNSGGTLSTLTAVQQADLQDFHKTRLGKNNLIVAVAGDITPKALEEKLDAVFGDLPEVELPQTKDLKLQNEGKVFVYNQDIPQTIIEIMQPGIDENDPEFPVAQIINYMLGGAGFGSRLMEEVREKRGLTYGIYSGLYNLKHLDALSISTSTENAKTGEVLELTKSVLSDMAENGITAEELETAKSYLIGSLPLSFTSTDRIAGILLSLQIDNKPIDYLEKRQEAIKAASLEDVKKLSKTLLTPDRFVTVLVGQAEGIENAQIIQSLPNVE